MPTQGRFDLLVATHMAMNGALITIGERSDAHADWARTMAARLNGLDVTKPGTALDLLLTTRALSGLYGEFKKYCHTHPELTRLGSTVAFKSLTVSLQ